MIKKIAAVITVSCFLFSFVLGDALHAALVPGTGSQTYEKALNGFVMPFTYGRITGGLRGDGPVVIHIQDLHCHPEVQKNISRILSLLDENYGPLSVFTEGAAGKVNTAWLSGVRDEALKTRIADSLLSRGELTGAEYYAALSKRPLRITGLEEPGLYAANVRRLSGLLEDERHIAALIDRMRGDLAALKAGHLGPRNLKLKSIAAKHDRGDIETGKYLRLLRKYAQNLGIDFAGYTSVNEYLELGDLKDTLNYQRAASDLRSYMEHLRGTLPYSSYNLLLTRTGNLTRLDELYADLAAFPKDKALAGYPSLARFLDYVSLSQRINPLRLVAEEKALLRLIRGNLSLNRSEREIVFLDDFLEYLSSYYSNKLTAEEYGYYKNNVGRFNELWSKYADTTLLDALEPYRVRYAEYYETNLRRNDGFLKAITAGTGDANRPAAREGIPAEILSGLAGKEGAIVVISGGFHSDALAHLLGGKGYSFLTITPNVTDDTAFSDSVYDALIRHQGTFLTQAMGAYLLSLYPASELGAKLVGEAISAEFPRVSVESRLSEEQVRQIEEKIQNDVVGALALSKALAGVRFEMSRGEGDRYPFKLAFRYSDGNEEILNFVYDPVSRSAVRTDREIPTTGLSGKEGDEPSRALTASSLRRPLRSLAQHVERKLWNLGGKELLAFSKDTVKDYLARYPARTEQDHSLDGYIETVIESKEFRRMISVTQGIQSSKRGTPKRMHHIIEVTKTAAQLADRLHMNVRIAMLFTLLHDLGHPVLGHIAEKMNNYGTAGQFTHDYSHNHQGAVITDHMFRGKMPDDLLQLFKTGISRHSDKMNRVDLAANKFGSPEGVLLMFSDAIAGINTDLRLAFKYGYVTLDDIHRALPELDTYREYTIDELADKVTEMLMDDLVESSNNGSVGFSKETVPFYTKVKNFILTDYIGNDKSDNEQWRDSLTQLLKHMSIEQQVVFLRTANDADFRKLLRQYHIPIPAENPAYSRPLSAPGENASFQVALVAPQSVRFTIKSFTLVSAQMGEEMGVGIRRLTMSPAEGIAVLRSRAKDREIVAGSSMRLKRTASDVASGAVKDFAAEVQKIAPEALEPLTVTTLEAFLGREDPEHMSYFSLNSVVRDIALKRPDLLTPSLLEALEAALTRHKGNEHDTVFLASSIDEICRANPDLLQPSTLDAFIEALQSQDAISANSISALANSIATLVKARPELLDRGVIEILGDTLERVRADEAVSLRVCEVLGDCVRIRNDLAIAAITPLEVLLKSGTAGSKLCERIAELIMEAGAINPDIISSTTFSALEKVMTREDLDLRAYAAVSAAIKAIARKKWNMIERNSLSRVVISQPDHISLHPLPHYRVYFNAYFDVATANLSPEDRYSIALSAYRLLRRMNLEATDASIEKAVRFVTGERSRISGYKVFAGGVSAVNIIGREKDFAEDDIIKFQQDSGVGNIASFKGSGAAADIAQMKSEALGEIAGTRGPLTIYFGGHGSQGHLWIDSSQRNVKRPDLSQAISYQELGDALLARGDIGRVCLLIDACYSYDFCVNLITYLAGRGAVGSPVLVSSSNLDQPSRLNLFKEGLLSINRPSGVNLKDIFDVEKKAFRYQDGAVFVPADTRTLVHIFGSDAVRALPSRGVNTEFPVSNISGAQSRPYQALPGDVVEIGLIPWLWRSIVPRVKAPAPLIGALGGFEEIIFSGVIVGGLSFLLGLIGVDHTIAIAAASAVSAVLFPLAHAKAVYGYSRTGLTRAPPSRGQLASIARLGIAMRLIFGGGLLLGFGLPFSLAAAGIAHAAFNAFKYNNLEKETLRADTPKEDPWKARFGDDVSFDESAGLSVEAVREGNLGEFRVKSGVAAGTAREHVIEFIGSLRRAVKAKIAEAKRLAGEGRREEAIQAFTEAQKMDPFAAIENFDPASVTIEGDRIVTPLGHEEGFADKPLSEKERLARYEKGILGFARVSGAEALLDGVKNQFRFSADNIRLIVSSIKTMNGSNWQDKLTKIFVGIMFLVLQVVPPMVYNSFDVSSGNIKKMEMFRPSPVTVTALDMFAVYHLAAGSWQQAIGYFAGSMLIRFLSRGMRGHELTHFYQHLVVHRMHEAGLVSSENKLPLKVFEGPAKSISKAPTRAQFDNVTRSIVRDALEQEDAGGKIDGKKTDRTIRNARAGVEGSNPMKIVSGAAVAGFVDSVRDDQKEARSLFPDLWDAMLYAVSKDPNVIPAGRWLAEANAAGIPGAAITMLPGDMPLDGMIELGRVLVPVPGKAAAVPVAVYAGVNESGTATLYLAVTDDTMPDEEFLGRAARAVMSELAENPRFSERLTSLYAREGMLNGRDTGRFGFGFKPGAVLLCGDEALSAAVSSDNEDVLENQFPAGVVFAYVQPEKAGREGWMNGKKALRRCDAVISEGVDTFAALEQCQQALVTKRAEGVLKGCEIIARVVTTQTLPDSSAGQAGMGKLIDLKNEIARARALGVTNVLLERLFNEELQSAIHEYLANGHKVPKVSGDDESAKKADALAQLKEALDLARKSGIRLHREFAVTNKADWKKTVDEMIFWLNTGIEGSRFDGMRLDLSAMKELSSAELEELAVRLRQGVLVTVVLPQESPRALVDTCRAVGFKVVKTYVAGAEIVRGAAGDNVCAEIHVPDGGVYVDAAKLKEYLESWKTIPADVLSMQMDILEGGTVSEDPDHRNPQRDRNIPALDARKMLALLQLGPVSGRRTAWVFADKDLPNGAEALSEIIGIIDSFGKADLSVVAGCDAVFAKATEGKKTVKRGAPSVWNEIEKISRQGTAEDTLGAKQELAERLEEFARGIAERMLFKESKGDVRFEDDSLNEEFAGLLLKSELAYTAYLDESGVKDGVTDEQCMQLLTHLLVLQRYGDAKTVMVTLASRFGADLPALETQPERLKTALQWAALLQRYTDKAGNKAILNEKLTGGVTLRTVAEKIAGMGSTEAGLKVYRFNAIVSVAALTRNKALKQEAKALEKEALAVVPETAPDKTAFLDAVAAGDEYDKEGFGRILKGIRILAKQSSEPEAAALAEWALDLHADKKFPELKMKDIVQPVFNTLSVAGIRSAA